MIAYQWFPDSNIGLALLGKNGLHRLQVFLLCSQVPCRRFGSPVIDKSEGAEPGFNLHCSDRLKTLAKHLHQSYQDQAGPSHTELYQAKKLAQQGQGEPRKKNLSLLNLGSRCGYNDVEFLGIVWKSGLSLMSLEMWDELSPLHCCLQFLAQMPL